MMSEEQRFVNSDFAMKIEGMLVKQAKAKVEKICDYWIEVYGSSYEFALEVQMEASFKEFFDFVVRESCEKKKEICMQLENLKSEARKIERRLKEKIVIKPEVYNLPLYQQLKSIKGSVDFYREKLKVRLSELAEMKKEAELLKAELDESSDSFPEVKEIPSEATMNELRLKLEALRQLKVDRMYLIAESQSAARELMKILSPVDEGVNKEFIQADNLQLTAVNVNQLKAIVAKLTGIEQKRKEMIANAMLKLEGPTGLWFRLDVSEQHKKLVKSDLPLKDSTIDKLNAEIDRCDEVEAKRKQLPELITNLRVEIIDMLMLCKKSHDEYSIANDAVEYNEKVLDLHEQELEVLKSYYEQHQSIITQLDERDKLKLEMAEMKNKQADVRDRLQNRGGQLLKEEKERKALEMKLLKAEVDLSKAVRKFESLGITPFTVYGNSIQIDSTAEHRYQMKKQASSNNLRLKTPLGNVSNF